MKELQTSGAACSVQPRNRATAQPRNRATAQPRNRATAQPRNSAGKSYSPELPGVGRIVRISTFNAQAGADLWATPTARHSEKNLPLAMQIKG